MPHRKGGILSRSLIRDQALAIIDEDGLSALTVRRLAARLGVQAPSLYTHFSNKEAVLDAVAERLCKNIDPSGFAESWQAGLHTWASSYYAAIHWHPKAAAVVVTGAGQRADYATIAGKVHDGLVGHGWPARQAIMAAAAAEFLVLGAATKAAGDTTNDDDRPPQPHRAGSPTGIDRFADTIDGASFTVALDSLIRGLESVYAEAVHATSVTPFSSSGPRRKAWRCAATGAPSERVDIE